MLLRSSAEVLQVLPERISEGHDSLVIVDHRLVGDIQSGPLGPVKGVVHEWLVLIPAEHREVIDVMGNCHAFDVEEAMGAAMHPAAVVGLHLEGVDEGVLQA